MITTPELSRPAPYRISARPAASASLTAPTRRPVLRAEQLDGVDPDPATIDVRRRMDDVAPDHGRQRQPHRAVAANLIDDLIHHGGNRGGRGGLGRLDPHPVASEPTGVQIDASALDPRSSDVDADRVTRHEPTSIDAKPATTTTRSRLRLAPLARASDPDGCAAGPGERWSATSRADGPRHLAPGLPVSLATAPAAAEPRTAVRPAGSGAADAQRTGGHVTRGRGDLAGVASRALRRATSPAQSTSYARAAPAAWKPDFGDRAAARGGRQRDAGPVAIGDRPCDR